MGITAIELAEGAPPYSNMHPMRVAPSSYPYPQAILLIPNNPAPRLKNKNRWSKEFVDFVGKCLEKDVNKRWSVSELLNVRLLLGCDG